MSFAYFIVLAAAAVFCCSAAATTTESPCCGVNEAKYPCGRRCEARCNAEPPTFCKGLMCLGFSCRCKNGYARNPKTNQCIKVRDCPANECPAGEVLGACGTFCEGTCRNPFEPEKCQIIDCQGASCRCDLRGGYVRNEKTNKCVRIENCPEFP